MENMDASREAQPCKSFAECMLGFDDLEHKTKGIFTVELSGLESLLNTIRATLDGVATKKAAVWLQQLTHMCLSPSCLDPNIASDSDEPRSQTETELLQETLPPCTCHHASDLMLDNLRDRIADQVLSTMEAFWKNRPTDMEELELIRQKLDEEMDTFNGLSASHAELAHALKAAVRKTEDLEVRLATSESSASDKERLFSDKYRELERDYYNKVQKLVESRVCDEKARLAGRLNEAEAKALRYVKLFDKNELLEAKILQGDREQVLLKRVKEEAEQKFKDRDDEARAFKEGYDQLSNDIQVLQTEKAILQTDYNELKKEHERPPKEHISSPEPRYIDQPTVSSSNASSTTALDRQNAELQHLDGLVAIWQTTLGNATDDRNGSRNRKEALEGKIREAEQQLKKLKPAPPSKPHRGSDTKSTPKNLCMKKQVVVEGESASQEVLQSSVSASGTLPKARISAEAFPTLSSPTVLKTTSLNTWKTLRLVDMPKEQIPNAQKRSG